MGRRAMGDPRVSAARSEGPAKRPRSRSRESGEGRGRAGSELQWPGHTGPGGHGGSLSLTLGHAGTRRESHAQRRGIGPSPPQGRRQLCANRPKRRQGRNGPPRRGLSGPSESGGRLLQIPARTSALRGSAPRKQPVPLTGLLPAPPPLCAPWETAAPRSSGEPLPGGSRAPSLGPSRR